MEGASGMWWLVGHRMSAVATDNPDKVHKHGWRPGCCTQVHDASWHCMLVRLCGRADALHMHVRKRCMHFPACHAAETSHSCACPCAGLPVTHTLACTDAHTHPVDRPIMSCSADCSGCPACLRSSGGPPPTALLVCMQRHLLPHCRRSQQA